MNCVLGYTLTQFLLVKPKNYLSGKINNEI